jgi:SAM-dependent methyltransferase
MRLLSGFERFGGTGRILDIGCGQGDFLHLAQQRGWAAYGSEFSPAAVALCRNRGLNVTAGDLAEADFGTDFFDVITAFEVLEHVNEPVKLLAQVRRLLRPGGLFYLTTPNFDALLRHAERAEFAMLGYPEHLCFYTPNSIKRLAHGGGFRVERVLTTGLDLARIKKRLKSAGQEQQSYSQQRQEGDEFRSRIETKPVLRLAKSAVNALLTATGTGDTLKVYLVRN